MSHYRYSGARPRPYLGSGDLENVQRHRDPSLASNSQQVRGIQFAEYKDDETLIRYNCTQYIHVPTIQLRRRRLNNFSRKFRNLTILDDLYTCQCPSYVPKQNKNSPLTVLQNPEQQREEMYIAIS